MSDRMEEIKKRYGWMPSLQECASFDVYHSDIDDHAPDFSWLISELERLRAENEGLDREIRLNKALMMQYAGELNLRSAGE